MKGYGDFLDNTSKFSGKAAVYSAARPSYPHAIFDFLKDELGVDKNTVFADIASGTGKFTEPLVKMGCTVYAVEPNSDMRTQAESLLGRYENFKSVNGSAENTCLPENSVDYVCAAQAFHWFDPGLFSQECKRILRPSGKVIILYNSRDANAVVTVRLAEICRRLCGGYKGMHGGFSEHGLKSFFIGGFKRLVFKNDLHYSRDLFVKRMLSASYAPASGDRSYKPFTDELCNLFDEFSKNGILHMPNNTYMYIGDV